MGRCKAVLPLQGCRTVLESAFGALRGGCNGPVVVVTGYHVREVAAVAGRLPVCMVHNHDAALGMFSSLRRGVISLWEQEQGNRPLDGILVLPVDIPLVRPATCALLAESFAANRCAVTYPVFGGVRGHPPLLRADVAAAVLSHTGEGGLRAVLGGVEAAGGTVDEVAVADTGILEDMDTPEAYERLCRKSPCGGVPTDEEVAELFRIADTPQHVRDHGAAVAAAALCMARALNSARAASGLPRVHSDTVRAAALLHDICKGARHHEETAGLFLTRHGFAETGSIVAAHRDIDPAGTARITERELVLLADKFVRGTTLTPIAARFDERLREWAHDAAAVRDIGGRKARALALCAMLEEELNADVFVLLRESGVCAA